jgi:Putative Actinobacterial Holin-X, holin superfamily III
MTTRDERSLGQLVATATEDLSNLIRGEIALAKSELKVSVSKLGQGAGLFAAAAFVAVLAVILLTITAALGLEEAGLPGWLSFLIVAVVFLLIAAALAFVGLRAFKKVGPPRRTIASVNEAKELLTNRGGDDTPSRPSPAIQSSRPAGIS